MQSSGRAAISLSRAVSSASMGGGCGDWSAANTPAADLRRHGLQSRDEVGQKAGGVVIPSSSDSQAQPCLTASPHRSPAAEAHATREEEE
jgi:hypothetical protein